MTFLSDVSAFATKTKERRQILFVNVCAAVKASITDGSSVTGAPGQPVKTGNLKDSWILEFESPGLAIIGTNVVYARAVEENLRGVTFRNHGPHSVRLTVNGFDQLVEHEMRKLGTG